ncbi:MAG: TadE/TadG family type IV pilus assembly protein, partial [Pseudomonadota bacterium]
MSARKPLWRQRYERFVADSEGVVAVEFAMIAFPFFILTIGLMEVALIFLMSTTLDYGTERASRQIRTGEFVGSGLSAAGFKQDICDNLFGLMDCDGKLHVDVKTLDDFGDADLSMPIDDDGNFTPDADFTLGDRDSLVLVRVYY